MIFEKSSKENHQNQRKKEQLVIYIEYFFFSDHSVPPVFSQELRKFLGILLEKIPSLPRNWPYFQEEHKHGTKFCFLITNNKFCCFQKKIIFDNTCGHQLKRFYQFFRNIVFLEYIFDKKIKNIYTSLPGNIKLRTSTSNL